MKRLKSAEFACDNYYHIFNRGTDKREIFMDDEDRLRFLHNMYEFNDVTPAPKWKENKLNLMQGKQPEINPDRKPIIDICCFCLMPNHYHFILKPLVENGISLFMQKLGSGYVNYFNLKCERSGTLFQGKFQAVYIKTDAQMMHLARYIHVLNPGELVEPKIREGIIKNPSALKNYLNNYRWSSHLDYLGQKNYSSIINKNIIAGYFNSVAEYEKFAMSWKTDEYDLVADIIDPDV